jgi:hypothetical protein
MVRLVANTRVVACLIGLPFLLHTENQVDAQRPGKRSNDEGPASLGTKSAALFCISFMV